MENVIIVSLLIAVAALALVYIIKEKKKGTKCIGCPNKNCNGKCNKE